MVWLLLAVAGLFEVAWAIGLNYTEGFARLWPTLGTALLGIVMLGKPASTTRLVSPWLIVAGSVELQLSSTH
jgi:quaternary ammonium compound-resistance protein SugE